MDNLVTLIPIVISVATAAGSAIAWMSNRGKYRADVSATNIEISIKLLNEIQEELSTTKERIQLLETAVSERDRRIAGLELQIIEEKTKRQSLEIRFSILEKERDELRAENERLRNRKNGDGLK